MYGTSLFDNAAFTHSSRCTHDRVNDAIARSVPVRRIGRYRHADGCVISAPREETAEGHLCRSARQPQIANGNLFDDHAALTPPSRTHHARITRASRTLNDAVVDVPLRRTHRASVTHAAGVFSASATRSREKRRRDKHQNTSDGGYRDKR